MNAIIHRDYSFKGTSINVEVYDDRVEIVNPGGLPQGLDKRDFGKLSVRRNLILADLFHRMGKVERIGSGIRRMRDVMRAANLKPPKFEVTTFFKAIFYRNPEYSLKATQATTQKTVEKTREKILRIIRENPMITVLELAQKLEIRPKGIEWNLTKAKKEGLLRRVGPDKGGRWEVSAKWEKR